MRNGPIGRALFLFNLSRLLKGKSMNSDQVLSLGRGVLKLLGGALVAWAASKYQLNPADATTLTTLLEGGGGAVAALLGFVLSHLTHAAK
jgi:hypothetical protein